MVNFILICIIYFIYDLTSFMKFFWLIYHNDTCTYNVFNHIIIIIKATFQGHPTGVIPEREKTREKREREIEREMVLRNLSE